MRLFGDFLTGIHRINYRILILEGGLEATFGLPAGLYTFLVCQS